MVKYNFYMPNAQFKTLKSYDKKEDITMSEHIRRAIDNYIKLKSLTEGARSPSKTK